jgi:hypothetical protein
MESDNQTENTKPWLWKKGQSGNILGRPKGKTMKEWAKEYLSRMTDEERDEFMQGMPKERIWAMAEGNPDTKSDITSGGLPLILPATLIEKNDTAQNTGDSSGEQAQV